MKTNLNINKNGVISKSVRGVISGNGNGVISGVIS